MIDLHCHLLPGLDDGARDVATSLNMARMLVANEVTVVACTPHIFPGVFPNSGPSIRQHIQLLQKTLNEENIPLQLVSGADNHITPHFVQDLRSGEILSLADGPYVLVELPHHVAPPKFEVFFLNLLSEGYIPILTHPERLLWFKSHFQKIVQLAVAGVWMQITSGSLLGVFGRTAQSAAETLLQAGVVHILATDSHDTKRRSPDLMTARHAAARIVGDIEAEHLVFTRPKGILEHKSPSDLPLPLACGNSRKGNRENYVPSKIQKALGPSMAPPTVHRLRRTARGL